VLTALYGDSILLGHRFVSSDKKQPAATLARLGMRAAYFTLLTTGAAFSPASFSSGVSYPYYRAIRGLWPLVRAQRGKRVDALGDRQSRYAWERDDGL